MRNYFFDLKKMSYPKIFVEVVERLFNFNDFENNQLENNKNYVIDNSNMDCDNNLYDFAQSRHMCKTTKITIINIVIYIFFRQYCFRNYI